jgi:hypothetical protein
MPMVKLAMLFAAISMLRGKRNAAAASGAAAAIVSWDERVVLR